MSESAPIRTTQALAALAVMFCAKPGNSPPVKKAEKQVAVAFRPLPKPVDRVKVEPPPPPPIKKIVKPVAAAAMMWMIPGFVADCLALRLTRRTSRHWLLRRTATHFETRVYRGTGVIHGEFTVVPENDQNAAQSETKDRPRIKDDSKIIDVE